MKNKKIKKIVFAFIFLVISIVLINCFCYLSIMGNYYTSYYGETTLHKFDINKYLSKNAKYNFKIHFSKIDIFGSEYEYKLKDGELCLYDRKVLNRCFYRTKEKAYDNDPYYYISNTYFKTLVDKNGYYQSNNKLYAYFGNKEEITIPSNIKEIAGTAFSEDFDRGLKLKKVTVPGTVETISTSSFSYTKAKEIVLEEGVKYIKRLAFANSQINKIYFPKSIEGIEFGILDTDYGQEDLNIYCYKNSVACNYLEQNKPNGKVTINYR